MISNKELSSENGVGWSWRPRIVADSKDCNWEKGWRVVQGWSNVPWSIWVQTLLKQEIDPQACQGTLDLHFFLVSLWRYILFLPYSHLFFFFRLAFEETDAFACLCRLACTGNYLHQTSQLEIFKPFIGLCHYTWCVIPLNPPFPPPGLTVFFSKKLQPLVATTIV